MDDNTEKLNSSNRRGIKWFRDRGKHGSGIFSTLQLGLPVLILKACSELFMFNAVTWASLIHIFSGPIAQQVPQSSGCYFVKVLTSEKIDSEAAFRSTKSRLAQADGDLPAASLEVAAVLSGKVASGQGLGAFGRQEGTTVVGMTVSGSPKAELPIG